MTTDLYLIRHGESVANVEPIVAGRHADVGLTERGHRQAALLGQRLTKHPIPADALYVSTLPRAQQTATYVSRALGLEPVVEDALRELDPGEADGLTLDEWARRWPRPRDDSLSGNPFMDFAPGGESWAVFLARSGAALQAVVDRHPDQTVAVVTHGGVIESSVALGFGLGATFHRVGFALLNTGVTHWRYRPDEERQPWVLVSLNDAHHLADEVADGSSHQAVPTPVEE
jgi:probable phosphoglycerate mutase